MEKYIIVHIWDNKNYEDGSFEIYGTLYDTKEEAQALIDYDLAYIFNEYLDEIERFPVLRIDPTSNDIIVLDDFGDEMIYDSWYIQTVYTK